MNNLLVTYRIWKIYINSLKAYGINSKILAFSLTSYGQFPRYGKDIMEI